MLTAFKNLIRRSSPAGKPVVEAYNIWSGSYDNQPGNLMLHLDEIIFSDLFRDVKSVSRQVADIGCGTGRHWQKLYASKPAGVTGFDVSEGMLEQLRKKYPLADTHRITDNLFNAIPDAAYDIIITTLTIAHIENIGEAIASWCRLLKPGGDLIITDFHPATLSKGGKRSFTHEGKSYSVMNYVHPLEWVKDIFEENGLTVIRSVEKYIDEDVKSFYAAQHALPVYEKYKGMPVIYGLHLKKDNAVK